VQGFMVDIPHYAVAASQGIYPFAMLRLLGML
jgi:hypothetical protein